MVLQVCCGVICEGLWAFFSDVSGIGLADGSGVDQ